MATDAVVLPSAAADIRAAALWYESRREGLGAEFVLELDALYERVALRPRQFPEVGDGARRAMLRRFPYAIYFVMAGGAPVVLAVLHRHRKPGTWRQRV